MPKRKPQRKTSTRNPRGLILRMVDLRPDTADEEDRSVDIVVATETPVPRMDEDTGEVYGEVLLMDGLTFRNPNRRQMPIVDSHNTSSVKHVYGSVRDLRVEGDEFVGRAVFAHDKDSQDAFRKLLDGHLTDFSVTAQEHDVQRIERGEVATIGDREFMGPTDLVLDWTPSDASIVAAGADANSTVRQLLRSYFFEGAKMPTTKTNTRLNRSERRKKAAIERRKKKSKRAVVRTVDRGQQIRGAMDALLESGMTVEEIAEETGRSVESLRELVAEDADQELLEALTNLVPDDDETRMEDEEGDEEREDDDADAERMEGEDEEERMDGGEEEREDDEDEATERSAERAVQRALRRDRIRRQEIRALGKAAGASQTSIERMCDSGISVSAARKKLWKKMANRSLGTTSRGEIRVTGTGLERMESAIRDGLIVRATSAIQAPYGKQRQDPLGGRKPDPGHEDFARMGFFRIAEEILRAGGINTRRMTKRDVAMVAMGHKATVNRLINNGSIQRSSEAWHTTGMLPNLMLDAANKSLLMGYQEADYTWSIWARQAPSVEDFKAINRIRFSDSPDLKMIPENDTYPEGKHSDKKESYFVNKFGRIFTITWETIVGDDLDAISRVPQMHGAAARRTQNQHVYGILTDNDPLSDGVALFHTASHGNLAGSGTVISTASLNTAYAAMRVQTGLAGQIIRIVPRFLIVPAAIEATAETQVASMAPPDVGGDTTGNSNVANLYGPGGRRRLTVVGEPELDGNSTTAWYLAAGTDQVDTVELTFLAGEESPVIESEWDFDRDVMKNKVRQTFGTKAIDHRGLYKNPGA